MIREDENALICDFAEYYNIYDYKKLRPYQAAILADGLPSESRIKMKLSGQNVKINTLLLACIADSLNILVWSKSKDAQDGVNRPVSLLGVLLNEEKEESAEFNSIEEYEAARTRIMEA